VLCAFVRGHGGYSAHTHHHTSGQQLLHAAVSSQGHVDAVVLAVGRLAVEHRAAQHQRHVLAVQVAVVDAVQTLDVLVPLRLERWEVEGGLALHLEAVGLGVVVQRLAQVGGVPHELLGHTAHVDARASDGPCLSTLHHAGLGAVLGGAAGGGQAAGPAPDAQNVGHVVTAHAKRFRNENDAVNAQATRGSEEDFHKRVGTLYVIWSRLCSFQGLSHTE
jgi:hypothetical protein